MQTETLQKQCEQCSELFTPQRSTGRFCSSACRLKAHHQRNQSDPGNDQENAMEDTPNAIDDQGGHSSPNANEESLNAIDDQGEQSTGATPKTPADYIDLAFRKVTVGTPAVCFACALPVDLDQEGVALVDGPIAVAYPAGKPICRSCMRPEDRAAFGIHRVKEDAEEQALIAKKEANHQAPFLALQKMFAFEANGLWGEASIAHSKEFIELTHKATRSHSDFIKACARIGMTARALDRAIIAANQLAYEVSTPPRKNSSEDILAYYEEASARLRTAREAINQAKAIADQAIPQAIETYAQVFESLAGIPLPPYKPKKRFVPIILPGQREATNNPEIQLPDGKWVYNPTGTFGEVHPTPPTPAQLLAFLQGLHE